MNKEEEDTDIQTEVERIFEGVAGGGEGLRQAKKENGGTDGTGKIV